MSQSASPCKLRRYVHLNIALGAVVFAVAVYIIITGTYENINAREHSEALLNRVAIGGLLYSLGCWYLSLFGQTLLCRSREVRE